MTGYYRHHLQVGSTAATEGKIIKPFITIIVATTVAAAVTSLTTYPHYSYPTSAHTAVRQLLAMAPHCTFSLFYFGFARHTALCTMQLLLHTTTAANLVLQIV
jgi:hypothetical protein